MTRELRYVRAILPCIKFLEMLSLSLIGMGFFEQMNYMA